MTSVRNSEQKNRYLVFLKKWLQTFLNKIPIAASVFLKHSLWEFRKEKQMTSANMYFCFLVGQSWTSQHFLFRIQKFWFEKQMASVNKFSDPERVSTFCLEFRNSGSKSRWLQLISSLFFSVGQSWTNQHMVLALQGFCSRIFYCWYYCSAMD